MTQAVADAIRRYRKERHASTQQLADMTDKLGLPIKRSVLANLENGRRGSVSVAELLVLAAALDVAPIDLIFPVGFDKEMEILPGRMMNPLSAMRWFAGEQKVDLYDDGGWTLRIPGSGERSSAELLRNHDRLVRQLESQEARARDALRAVSDAVGGEADERARAAARDFMVSVEEWREFIREPLRRTRGEMRERGMLLPPVPPELGLDGEDEEPAGGKGGAVRQADHGT
jgi:transcriptional regulator with XRE-family HTH domain